VIDESRPPSHTDRIVWAYRYFDPWSLNLREIRRPEAIQALYFVMNSPGVLEYGGRRENVTGESLFVFPPGMAFHLSPGSPSPIDCVHIQSISPRWARERYPLPAKLWVHDHEIAGSIMAWAVEYAKAGEISGTIWPVLERVYSQQEVSRVTFADHAETRPPRDTPLHSHMKEHQIDYYLRARGRFWINGHWEEIEDGDLFYIPPRAEHAIEFDPECDYHNLSLKFVVKDPVDLSGEPFKIPVIDEDRHLRNAMQRIVASYVLYSPVSPDDLQQVLSGISDIYRLGSTLGSPSPEERIKEIVMANYSMPLSLPWLSRQVGLKPAYLSRLFRERTGETLSTYIRRVRIQRSQELLSQTNLPVGVVAQRCGFSNIHYFSQVFKKETGLAPSGYRRTAGRAAV
jgi:AraC-like DNA-binding protein/quercetin dioxygenase-like cupin family protein